MQYFQTKQSNLFIALIEFENTDTLLIAGVHKCFPSNMMSESITAVSLQDEAHHNDVTGFLKDIFIK